MDNIENKLKMYRSIVAALDHLACCIPDVEDESNWVKTSLVKSVEQIYITLIVMKQQLEDEGVQLIGGSHHHE